MNPLTYLKLAAGLGVLALVAVLAFSRHQLRESRDALAAAQAQILNLQGSINAQNAAIQQWQAAGTQAQAQAAQGVQQSVQVHRQVSQVEAAVAVAQPPGEADQALRWAVGEAAKLEGVAK